MTGRRLAWLCYLVLAVELAAFGLLWLLPALGLCRRIDLEGTHCSGEMSLALAEGALTVAFLSLVSIAPLLLAFIGLLLLGHRAWEALRERGRRG